MSDNNDTPNGTPRNASGQGTPVDLDGMYSDEMPQDYDTVINRLSDHLEETAPLHPPSNDVDAVSEFDPLDNPEAEEIAIGDDEYIRASALEALSDDGPDDIGLPGDEANAGIGIKDDSATDDLGMPSADQLASAFTDPIPGPDSEAAQVGSPADDVDDDDLEAMLSPVDDKDDTVSAAPGQDAFGQTDPGQAVPPKENAFGQTDPGQDTSGQAAPGPVVPHGQNAFGQTDPGQAGPANASAGFDGRSDLPPEIGDSAVGPDDLPFPTEDGPAETGSSAQAAVDDLEEEDDDDDFDPLADALGTTENHEDAENENESDDSATASSEDDTGDSMTDTNEKDEKKELNKGVLAAGVAALLVLFGGVFTFLFSGDDAPRRPESQVAAAPASTPTARPSTPMPVSAPSSRPEASTGPDTAASALDDAFLPEDNSPTSAEHPKTVETAPRMAASDNSLDDDLSQAPAKADTGKTSADPKGAVQPTTITPQLEAELASTRAELASVSGRNEKLEKRIAELEASIKRLRRQMLANARAASRKRKTSTRPPRKTRKQPATVTVTVVVPGRAALDLGGGRTMLVTQGDKVPGYGIVKRITVAGCVYTEKGLLRTPSARCVN